MNLTQIVVIVAGLFFGYRLVGYMLSPGNGDQKPTPKPSPEGARDTKDSRDNSHDSAQSETPTPTSAALPTWYQTLGVGESASPEEIDHAYRVQISQYHPDKVAKIGDDIRQLAEARSKEINGAYDVVVRLRR